MWGSTAVLIVSFAASTVCGATSGLTLIKNAHEGRLRIPLRGVSGTSQCFLQPHAPILQHSPASRLRDDSPAQSPWPR